VRGKGKRAHFSPTKGEMKEGGQELAGDATVRARIPKKRSPKARNLAIVERNSKKGKKARQRSEKG